MAGTLFLQGLTLPWFARRLNVPSPDPAADALARATLLQQASKAGFARLDEFEHDDHHGGHDLIRQRMDQRNFAASERIGTVADEETPASSTPGSGSRSRRNARGCWRSAAAAPSPPTLVAEVLDLEQYPATETQSEPVCDACLRRAPA